MTDFDQLNGEFEPDNLRQIFNTYLLNSGTVGKDGIHPKAFSEVVEDEIQLIRKNVYAKKYRFTSFKQRLISKGAGKPPREIAIAGVRDRLTLRAITNILMNTYADAKLAPAHHFIRDVVDFIRPLDDEYVFLQLDIVDFYPSLRHDYLSDRLRQRIVSDELMALIQSAVKTSTGDGPSSKQGVPQGLSVSNILSSIYMIEIDREARERFQYFRYVDDILVICKRVDAHEHFEYLRAALDFAGLRCHPMTTGSKSKIAALSEGVDYLGYHISSSAVRVRQSSYRRMMATLVSVVTSAKYKSGNARVLARINLKITGCILEGKRFGWMFFFSMSEDVGQLKRLDRFVSRLWTRSGLPSGSRPKTFVKTYHEIRFNAAATKYIPRFDDYTIEKKMMLIAELQEIDLSDVRDWTEDKIEKTFWRLVRKEVSELEKDLTPVS